MLKTKQSVLVDARTNKREIIYFEITNEQRDANNVSFLVQAKIMVQDKLQDLIRIPAIYKRSTFFGLFGAMTLNDFEEQKYELAKSQIEYNKEQYWDLTANDLEDYNP